MLIASRAVGIIPVSVGFLATGHPDSMDLQGQRVGAQSSLHWCCGADPGIWTIVVATPSE